jgi:hypothetical protein
MGNYGFNCLRVDIEFFFMLWGLDMPTKSTPLTRTLGLLDKRLYSKWDMMCLLISWKGGLVGVDEADNYPDAIDRLNVLRLDSEIESIRVVGSRAGKPRTLYQFTRPRQ